MKNDEKLDLVCAGINRSDTLNVLAQCKSDYPEKTPNNFKWRNAYALVQQLPHLQLPSAALMLWLEEMAANENGK